MDNFKIFIPKRLFNLPPNQLYVYMAIQPICSINNNGKSIVTINMINYYMYGKLDVERKTTEIIKEGLSGLIKDEIIKAKKIANGHYEIYRSSFTVNKDEYFSIVLKKDISIIKKPILCKYYAILISTCNNKTHIGQCSSLTLSEYMNCSERTIYRYNEELENLGVIYIRRFKNNQESHQANIYGHYNYKDIIDKYADSKGYGKKYDGNQLRSISARYNAFKNGAKLTAEEEAKLYEDCLLYNSIMEDKQSKQPGNDYIRKKKDLTIFCY